MSDPEQPYSPAAAGTRHALEDIAGYARARVHQPDPQAPPDANAYRAAYAAQMQAVESFANRKLEPGQ